MATLHCTRTARSHTARALEGRRGAERAGYAPAARTTLTAVPKPAAADTHILLQKNIRALEERHVSADWRLGSQGFAAAGLESAESACQGHRQTSFIWLLRLTTTNMLAAVHMPIPVAKIAQAMR